MDQKLPTIPVEPWDIGLFVTIVLTLGWVAGNPTATYEIAIGQPPPAIVELALQILIFSLSPLIAVAILLRRLQLPGGLRTFLCERFHWRIEGRWYLVAVGLMPVLFAVTYLGFIAFNQPITVELTIVSMVFLEVLTLGIFFNLVENYGWRGFLQEALQSRVSAFVATLGVGVIWGLWHAALFLPGGGYEGFPVTSFVLVVIGESIIIGLVYNSTGGSVLHAAIMHTSFNASFGVLITSMSISNTSVDAFYAATAVVIWLAVPVIVYWTGPSTSRWQ